MTDGNGEEWRGEVRDTLLDALAEHDGGDGARPGTLVDAVADETGHGIHRTAEMLGVLRSEGRVYRPEETTYRRVETDGGCDPAELPRVVACDVERTGVAPDGEYHLDPNTVALRVAYLDSHENEYRLTVSYRIEGASAVFRDVDFGHGTPRQFRPDVHLPAAFEADARVAELPFVQAVEGVAQRVSAVDAPVAAGGGDGGE